jgi:hypothetical protein
MAGMLARFGLIDRSQLAVGDPAVALADHVVERIGPANPISFCQANG